MKRYLMRLAVLLALTSSLHAEAGEMSMEEVLTSVEQSFPLLKAAELEQALRTRSLFERWQQTQEEPDEVDASLAATDAQASVKGKQSDLRIELIVTTSLAGSVLKHRLNLLAGPHWQLHDVSAA